MIADGTLSFFCKAGIQRKRADSGEFGCVYFRAKIKPHNFMNLRYSLWTQDLDKRTNKGCKAKPTNKLVTKQGINR